MELKSWYLTLLSKSLAVLIVPLWNWNGTATLCLNRYAVLIVPLWNWNLNSHTFSIKINLVLIVPLWNWNIWAVNMWRCDKCFNRTFMELKLLMVLLRTQSLRVLIVPLWNWNDGYEGMAFCRWTVLIVPLWNWN